MRIGWGRNMLNEDKIKLMAGIAMFEKREGKRIFPVNRYFRSDYISKHLFHSFFSFTISYLLCAVIWVLYNMERILNAMALEEIIAAQDIEFQNAGTLAEAALKLNKIFADADAAAAAYLRNVRHTVEEGGRFADETRLMAGKPETLRRRNMPGPGKRTP